MSDSPRPPPARRIACLRLLPLLALGLLGVGCQVDLPLPPATDAGIATPDTPTGGAPPEDAPPLEPDPWTRPAQTPAAPAPEGPTPAPPSQAEARPAPLPRMPDVEAGDYANDPRWPGFVRDWPARVTRALDRLEVVTGLDFAETGRPRVILRPFGDETRRHELRAEIVQGRRHPVVHVNIEPLIAGVHDPDRTLLRALVDAAFQDAGRRAVPVPPWFTRFAGAVAAADADRRIADLRRAALEDTGVTRVDPEDPAAAEATGLAVFVMLADQLEPGEMRRTIRFVADGDDADEVVGRMVRALDGGWTRGAQLALGERLAAVDVSPWRLLAASRRALQELGRTGLEASLPETVPTPIADEVQVLRAEGALDEGDLDAARGALDALSPDAAARLEDPAAALALRIDLATRHGGDAGLARRLTARLDRDFPASDARERLRRARPLLGMQEDPQRWLAMMGERISRRGTQDLDLDVLARYLRMLVADHRAGAAMSVIATLGDRRIAPELQAVVALVEDAQRDPSPAALARGRARVARWGASGSEEDARAVRSTGRAAGPALVAWIDTARTDRRADAVQLLVDTVGGADAVLALRARWAGDPGRIQRDLFALAGSVTFAELEAVLETPGLGEAEAQALAKGWQRLTLGLSHRWLGANPTFLHDLRAADFERRRGAFVRIGREAPREITPGFVAHGLGDRAALLRREAAALAGITGFRALALRALEDPAWLVREEAVRSLARIDGREGAGLLITGLRDDPSLEVRAAAATALIRIAPESPRAVDALLRSQVAEEARLRDAIGARLAELPPTPVVRGIVRGWQRALERSEPSRGYLFRTALLFGRLTGRPLGYYPGATRAEIGTMLATMEDWLTSDAAEAGMAPASGDEGARRVPAGRER